MRRVRGDKVGLRRPGARLRSQPGIRASVRMQTDTEHVRMLLDIAYAVETVMHYGVSLFDGGACQWFEMPEEVVRSAVCNAAV